MTWALDTAAVTAVAGAVSGLAVPALIARIPEPVPEPVPEPAAVAAAAGADAPRSVAVKEPYAAIASLPGLGWKASLAAALAAGLVGLQLGWQWTLLPLVTLVPVGVALAVVDWRTRLLPTRVIAPTYVVLGVLAVAVAVLADDWPSLVRAVWGLVLARGAFWLLWLVHPRGMGFGDVRLAGVLGLALGLLGWGQLLLGIYAGFVLGGVGGLLLAAVGAVDRGAYPFGPFMLLGALVGVLGGATLVDAYLGRL